MNEWIGVDLDRTVAHYTHWRDHFDTRTEATRVGAPIIPMVERVREWLAAGIEVKIVTARICNDVPTVRQPIEDFCMEQFGQVLPITNAKDFDMKELWDDRAIQVEPNTGIALVEALRALVYAMVRCVDCSDSFPACPTHFPDYQQLVERHRPC